MARLAAFVLLVLGLLPIVNWVPGGHEAPWYGAVAGSWLTGTVMLGLVIALSTLLTKRKGNDPQLVPRWERIANWWDRGGFRSDLLAALLAVVIAACVSWFILSARPLLIDEIIQAFQAKIFASGRLWLPSPQHPEFSASTHLLDLAGRRFGQFPPGWSAFLAIFILVGAGWLAGPVVTGFAVFVFARLMRVVELSPATRSTAVGLFLASPFAMILGASYMNHMATLACLLLAALGVAHLAGSKVAAPWWAFVVGSGLGMAAMIRPLDAFAFAVPTAIWLLWVSWHNHSRWRDLVLGGIGVAIPISLLLSYNAATTGAPLTFGYIALWGPSHRLGFHPIPWGPPHTPLRGLELINLYLLRIQSVLFESPAPGLLAATAALFLAKALDVFDRWLIACSGALLLAYFFYWHDGNYLGPRFVLPLVPVILLWSARLPILLRSSGVPASIRRGLGIAVMVSIAWATAGDLPVRLITYANGLQTMRWNPESVNSLAGDGATVLVRESWGAELLTRLSAAGLNATETEHLYHRVDSCDLESQVSKVESMQQEGEDVRARTVLDSLRNSEQTLVAMPTSPDTSLRWHPGHQLDPVCSRRLAETKAGFTLYSPLLLAPASMKFVRDLHARDTLMFPLGSEPEWLLIGDPIDAEGPRLIHLDRDSLMSAWGRNGARQ